MSKILLDQLTPSTWLLKTETGQVWRIDDRYKACNMWVFYLAPIACGFRSGGALYDLREIDASFQLFEGNTQDFFSLSDLAHESARDK